MLVSLLEKNDMNIPAIKITCKEVVNKLKKFGSSSKGSTAMSSSKGKERESASKIDVAVDKENQVSSNKFSFVCSGACFYCECGVL